MIRAEAPTKTTAPPDMTAGCPAQARRSDTLLPEPAILRMSESVSRTTLVNRDVAVVDCTWFPSLTMLPQAPVHGEDDLHSRLNPLP